MKSWSQFLIEKKDKPFDRYERERQFPMDSPAPEDERELVEDPRTQPIWYNIHTTKESGIFYVLVDRTPVMDGCEWWIKTVPVRLIDNTTVVELTPKEMGYGYSSHYTQVIPDLTVYNNCNQYKVKRYI